MAAQLVEDFLEAAQEGFVGQVGALLDAGVDIEARDIEDRNALHWASEEGHGEVVALLLDRGADIEAVTDDGRTPILIASRNGHLEVVELLHARGANIEAVSASGSTPIMIASQSGRLQVVKLLHARGASIHRVDANGQNALHWAAWYGRLPVCEFLLSKGADLMAATNNGRTAVSHYGKNSQWGDNDSGDEQPDGLKTAALHAARGAYLLDENSALKCHNDRLSAVMQTTASLLFSDAFSDLVFVCPGGERIHAHRNIVSACSAHARALLQGPWAENADERVAVVQMPQSAVAVRALLRFMYTGEVDAAAVQASMSDVLDLASQHEQPALKAACERHAIAALSVATVVRSLVTAHVHDLAALKAACVGLIMASAQNATAVTHSKTFFALESTHPQLWRELRVALGLPKEEEEEEEAEEEGQDHKRARHEN